MALNCRFSNCDWQGGEDDIFEHFELKHKKYLREPKGQLYYEFNFYDLQQELFVLCSSNNLYYFRQNLHKPRSDGIDFGVFHIGESEQVKYTLKLGLKRDGDYSKHWGPLESKKDVCLHPSLQDFNLNFDFNYLEMLNTTTHSRCLRLYFGKFCDDDDDTLSPTSDGIDWNAKVDHFNRLLLEQFTCAICFELIRRDARFCENRHFICLNCFDLMHQHKKLICPTCRGQYLYDCSDDHVECLLRTIKWPDRV